jgi:hypothetical protein
MAAPVAAPAGTPNPATAETLALVVRTADGKVADSASAAALGSLGGKAKAERDRVLAALPTLLRGFGMRGEVAPGFADYIPDALDAGFSSSLGSRNLEALEHGAPPGNRSPRKGTPRIASASRRSGLSSRREPAEKPDAPSPRRGTREQSQVFA